MIAMSCVLDCVGRNNIFFSVETLKTFEFIVTSVSLFQTIHSASNELFYVQNTHTTTHTHTHVNAFKHSGYRHNQIIMIRDISND